MEDETSDPEDLHRFETADEAFSYLRYTGTLKDEEIDIGEAALALGLLFLPGVSVDRYRQHLRKLREQAREEYLSRLRMKEKDGARLRAQVLRKLLHDAHGYRGDAQHYDDLQNANLIRVIERRKGLPVALGILYLVIARALEWDARGLSFPGHFVLRLEDAGERLILDPFREGKELDAAELRQLLKSVAGAGAELAHEYYAPVSARDVLVRLANNLKKRLIEAEEYAQAVIVVEAMEALAPDEYRTLFDKGVLYVKLGQRGQAITALEHYIEKTPDPREKNQAKLLLQQIRMEPD
jgi:regulator of sirC expression with transglutaminase-like and TPR domain